MPLRGADCIQVGTYLDNYRTRKESSKSPKIFKYNLSSAKRSSVLTPASNHVVMNKNKKGEDVKVLTIDENSDRDE
jgi:hypothetical protein